MRQAGALLLLLLALLPALAVPAPARAAVYFLFVTRTDDPLVGGIPVASQSATDLARDTVLAVPKDIEERKSFAHEVQAVLGHREPPASRRGPARHVM